MKRRNPRIGLVLAAAAILVIIGSLGELAPMRWVYNHTLVPVGRSLTAAGSGTGNFFHTLGQVSSLARQNSQLQATDDQLKAQLAALGQVQQENVSLRQQVGLDAASGWRVVGADTVAYQPDSYRQYLTIDRGSAAGVAVGQAATSDGLLVGVVSQVSHGTAKIMLLSDPDFRLAVQDQDTGATGLLEGQLGAGLVMNDISQTDTVHAGDTIVTSQLGGSMPAGIAIGQVETVNTAANQVFQSAAVTPSQSTTRLQLVFIVLAP